MKKRKMRKMQTMRNWIAAACVVLCGGIAWGEQTRREIAWPVIQQQGELVSGKVHPAEGDQPAYLRVTNPENQPATFRVLLLKNPGVTTATYAIKGKIRYEGVEGDGYMEMWNYFPDGKRFFSRTLTGGLLKPLSGTADWRHFAVPFFIGDNPQRPVRLVVNVVLPGRGTVDIGPLQLVEYAAGEDPLAIPGVWWAGRTGGLLGGILGCVLGLMGAIIGMLCGRGKARRLVLGMMKLMGVLGVSFLVAAGVAMAMGQPSGVWYVMLLPGIICTILAAILLPVIRRRYQADELRKIEAMDA